MAAYGAESATPPNTGPPWTTGGALFLGPPGWTSFRAVVKNFLPFPLLFPNKRGVDLYLVSFFWGPRGGLLFGPGTNKGGGSLLGRGGYCIKLKPKKPLIF